MFKKNLRRAIMRYVNLSSILALRLIASKVNTRFPTYNSLVDAKLLLPSEVTFSFQIHCTFMTKYYAIASNTLKTLFSII